jgi:hypothetical protein
MPRKKSFIPWKQRSWHKRKLVPLTDEQWKNIKQLSNLPETARRPIESCISQYLFFKADSVGAPTPAKTLARLRELREAVNQLLEGLKNPGRDVLSALLESAGTAEPMRIMRANELLERKKQELTGLINWLKKAESSIPHKKTGPDTSDKDWLVNELDDILYQHTGKHIDRSTNRNATSEYIKAVCHVADNTIGPGTIDFSIKRSVTRRRQLAGKNRRNKK